MFNFGVAWTTSERDHDGEVFMSGLNLTIRVHGVQFKVEITILSLIDTPKKIRKSPSWLVKVLYNTPWVSEI